MIVWAHGGGSFAAAFLASLVECVEALTIVLAVGTVRGWRPALVGAGAGAVLLAVAVAILGPLIRLAPLSWLQTAIGVLLLLFGLRWLRKAVLRAAGIVPLHDETAAYNAEQRALRQAGASHGAWDAVALVTSFKAVVLEGIEVVFIVLAVGGAGATLAPAIVGAAAALAAVIALGAILHRPLARVPENTLKFAVGVLLSAFGVFWTGEGIGFGWPGEDLAIPVLVAAFLAVALYCVFDARKLVGRAAGL